MIFHDKVGKGDINMFIFQSKFNNPPYCDHITEKSGTSKKNQWDFQISKVGSLDFLNLKVNGSPGRCRFICTCSSEFLSRPDRVSDFQPGNPSSVAGQR